MFQEVILIRKGKAWVVSRSYPLILTGILEDTVTKSVYFTCLPQILKFTKVTQLRNTYERFRNFLQKIWH